MPDIYNYDLTVEQDAQHDLDVQTDDYVLGLNEAINVIIHSGGAVYYDTRAAWDMQPQLIAERGAIYIYSDKATIYDGVGNPTFVPGVKVGDGTSYLIDMPFVGDEILLALSQHVANTTVHITQAERVFWNNKVSGFVDAQNPENLILSKITYMED